MAEQDKTVKAHPIQETFAHLTDEAASLAIPVTADFWEKGVRELPPGRLVSAFKMEKDWTVWERHPHGDEIVYQIEGSSTLVLEMPEGPQSVRLTRGSFVIVPQGVWHTADVIEPGLALFITRGEGTEHRPR